MTNLSPYPGITILGRGVHACACQCSTVSVYILLRRYCSTRRPEGDARHVRYAYRAAATDMFVGESFHGMFTYRRKAYTRTLGEAAIDGCRREQCNSCAAPIRLSWRMTERRRLGIGWPRHGEVRVVPAAHDEAVPEELHL